MIVLGNWTIAPLSKLSLSVNMALMCIYIEGCSHLTLAFASAFRIR